MQTQKHATEERTELLETDNAGNPAELSDSDTGTVNLAIHNFPVAARPSRNIEQLNAFFSDNFTSILALVRSKSFRTPDMAEDVAQELYGRMVRSLNLSVDGIDEPWAMAHVITNRLAIDQLRRASTITRRFTPLYEDSIAAPKTLDSRPEIVDESMEIAIHRAIQELADRQQTVILEIFFQGKRAREVARELGLSESYVAEIKAAALTQIGRHLRRQVPWLNEPKFAEN